MKKTAIFILCILVIYLAVSYRQAQIRQLGEEFVTHAYYGELLETKESLENGAALDYVLYLKDPQRQYDGVYFNVLQAAASGGNEKIISYLLKQEMDINTRTPQGWTPLIIAVRDGQTTAAKALIYYKADLNAQTDLGATALMMAVTQEFPSEKEREELLVYMLKRGANPNLTNAFGYSALYYAAALHKANIAKILYEYGANPSTEEKQKIQELLKGKKEPEAKEILQLLKRKPQAAPQPKQD